MAPPSRALTPAVSLAGLSNGRVARVAGFAEGTADLEARLREVGFAEGDEVEVLHQAPLGDALSVRLNRTMIALRREEADAVLVALPTDDRHYGAAAAE